MVTRRSMPSSQRIASRGHDRVPAAPGPTTLFPPLRAALLERDAFALAHAYRSRDFCDEHLHAISRRGPRERVRSRGPQRTSPLGCPGVPRSRLIAICSTGAQPAAKAGAITLAVARPSVGRDRSRPSAPSPRCRCGTQGRVMIFPPGRPISTPRRCPTPQSSRCTRSMRSWRSCASSESVAIGRASSRRIPIGSPLSSQYP